MESKSQICLTLITISDVDRSFYEYLFVINFMKVAREAITTYRFPENFLHDKSFTSIHDIKVIVIPWAIFYTTKT